MYTARVAAGFASLAGYESLGFCCSPNIQTPRAGFCDLGAPSAGALCGRICHFSRVFGGRKKSGSVKYQGRQGHGGGCVDAGASAGMVLCLVCRMRGNTVDNCHFALLVGWVGFGLVWSFSKGLPSSLPDASTSGSPRMSPRRWRKRGRAP